MFVWLVSYDNEIGLSFEKVFRFYFEYKLVGL